MLEAALDERGPEPDVGRLLIRTVCEPNRYYAMTGACTTRGAWEARHPPATFTHDAQHSVLSGNHRQLFGVDSAVLTEEVTGDHPVAVLADERELPEVAVLAPAPTPGCR